MGRASGRLELWPAAALVPCDWGTCGVATSVSGGSCGMKGAGGAGPAMLGPLFCLACRSRPVRESSFCFLYSFLKNPLWSVLFKHLDTLLFITLAPWYLQRLVLVDMMDASFSSSPSSATFSSSTLAWTARSIFPAFARTAASACSQCPCFAPGPSDVSALIRTWLGCHPDLFWELGSCGTVCVPIITGRRGLSASLSSLPLKC